MKNFWFKLIYYSLMESFNNNLQLVQTKAKNNQRSHFSSTAISFLGNVTAISLYSLEQHTPNPNGVVLVNRSLQTRGFSIIPID